MRPSIGWNSACASLRRSRTRPSVLLRGLDPDVLDRDPLVVADLDRGLHARDARRTGSGPAAPTAGRRSAAGPGSRARAPRWRTPSAAPTIRSRTSSRIWPAILLMDHPFRRVPLAESRDRGPARVGAGHVIHRPVHVLRRDLDLQRRAGRGFFLRVQDRHGASLLNGGRRPGRSAPVKRATGGPERCAARRGSTVRGPSRPTGAARLNAPPTSRRPQPKTVLGIDAPAKVPQSWPRGRRTADVSGGLRSRPATRAAPGRADRAARSLPRRAARGREVPVKPPYPESPAAVRMPTPGATMSGFSRPEPSTVTGPRRRERGDSVGHGARRPTANAAS